MVKKTDAACFRRTGEEELREELKLENTRMPSFAF